MNKHHIKIRKPCGDFSRKYSDKFSSLLCYLVLFLLKLDVVLATTQCIIDIVFKSNQLQSRAITDLICCHLFDVLDLGLLILDRHGSTIPQASCCTSCESSIFSWRATSKFLGSEYNHQGRVVQSPLKLTQG